MRARRGDCEGHTPCSCLSAVTVATVSTAAKVDIGWFVGGVGVGERWKITDAEWPNAGL